MSVDVQNAKVDEDEASLNVAINTTPLVDVMLVMLIIFLVTIPVIVKTIPLQLPTYRNIVTQTKPENIVIFVTADEVTYDKANGDPIDQATLRAHLVKALQNAIAAHRSLPEVHIRADKGVRFEAVGRVILACQQAGIQKVGFITEPHNLDASSM
jgi:biopolymer transport protein ExbD